VTHNDLMVGTPHGVVSEREAEVLALLGDRLSNAEIAGRLRISVRTVESHVSSLLRKYCVGDRNALTGLSRSRRSHVITGLAPARDGFVGRTRERDLTIAAVDVARLTTLVGPGGVGKTRLAAVVAEELAPTLPHGGAYVDLVPVGGSFVVQAVAAVLGVAGSMHQSLEDAIAERLAPGRTLLVLDNCEHLIEPVAGFVDRLLSACPEARVLVTSRERLGIPGERLVPIGPLPLVPDAYRLFHERAAAVDPDFAADPDAVRQLCARLDGMPLAIELAAARSASLGLDGLLAAVDDTLRLLSGRRGTDTRHRSMRAVIDWSHRLLSDQERALFRRLAVFRGDCDLGAVVAVAGADGPDSGEGGTDPTVAVTSLLGQLVDKSLVVRVPGEPARWRLLETIRAFALEQLRSSAELDVVERRHRRWAASAALDLETRLDGDWRDDFDRVADDLRGAVSGAGANADPVLHQLARSLGHLTYARRFLLESIGHYLLAADRAVSASQAARDLRSAADCAHVSTTSGEQAFELLLRSAEQAHAGGDGNARALALTRAVEMACRHPAMFASEPTNDLLRTLLDEARTAGDERDPAVRAALTIAAAWLGSPAKNDPDLARAEVAVAAARETGDPVLISAGLDAVSTAARNAGSLSAVRRLTDERMTLLGEMDRTDPYAAPEIVDTFGVAAADAIVAGDLAAALSIGHQVIEDDLLGNHSAIAAAGLIPPLVLTGDLKAAVRYATQLWRGWQRAGRPIAGWMAPAVSTAALAHGLLGDREAFIRWRRRVRETAWPGHQRELNLASDAFVDARFAVATGDLSNATATVRRTFAPYPGARYQTYARAAGAELAVLATLPDAATLLRTAAETTAGNAWAVACLARATARLEDDPDALVACVERWESIGARYERASTLLLIADRAEEGRAEFGALGCPVEPAAPQVGPTAGAASG
jgi:predicted ATPase/DNA-binding CsgD family transcriptional regulator